MKNEKLKSFFYHIGIISSALFTFVAMLWATVFRRRNRSAGGTMGTVENELVGAGNGLQDIAREQRKSAEAVGSLEREQRESAEAIRDSAERIEDCKRIIAEVEKRNAKK